MAAIDKSQKYLVKLKKAYAENEKGNYLKSISICKKILGKERENVATSKLLITNLIKLHRFLEVEIVLKKTLKFANTEDSDALLHLLGCNYISLENYDSALCVLEELFNKSGDCKVLLDIALSYANLGEYENARDVYLKLIELDPNNHQAKFNLYPILLYFKAYKDAWTCFHSRLERQEIKDQVYWFAPQWAGEQIAGKKILIYPEQGIGDNLAYTGCFEEAIAAASATYIVCDNRLKGLYQHNFPQASVISYDDVNRKQQVDADLDCQILAGSLGYLYRLDEQAFIDEPKLTISEALQQDKNKLLSTKKLKIGLSWFHGRVNNGNDNSMNLEELLPLLKMDNIEWVNLQFGEWESEVCSLEKKYGIKISHFEECSAAGDFEHYGALIANLDLVISASNAALMLASRLGVKSWMFLPAPKKLLQRSDFKESISMRPERRFYKDKNNGWDSVIEQMCTEMASLQANVVL